MRWPRASWRACVRSLGRCRALQSAWLRHSCQNESTDSCQTPSQHPASHLAITQPTTKDSQPATDPATPPARHALDLPDSYIHTQQAATYIHTYIHTHVRTNVHAYRHAFAQSHIRRCTLTCRQPPSHHPASHTGLPASHRGSHPTSQKRTRLARQVHMYTHTSIPIRAASCNVGWRLARVGKGRVTASFGASRAWASRA